MLTAGERWVFAVAVLLSMALTARGAWRIYRILTRAPNDRDASVPTITPSTVWHMLTTTLTLRPVFRSRPRVALAHAFVAWCFMFYLLVNIGDLFEGFVPHVQFLGDGVVGGVYRLVADFLSVGALVGMAALLVRRFVVRPSELETVNLSPHSARAAIRRDSAIVGAFILLHVGARFLGRSFHLAATEAGAWEPLASVAGFAWSGASDGALDVAQHVCWWLAMGLILAFLPYFPYSKHVHLLFAPLNLLLNPRDAASGTLQPISLETEPFGASRLDELPRARLMDAYACIQCNRCQDACPATAAGTALSPSALEIGKRRRLNAESGLIAAGQPSREPLLAFALSEDALWACTSCGACAEACPVGNAPLQDIATIRRHQTLAEGALPPRGAAALRNIAVLGNPWGGAPSERAAWARDLGVKTLAEAGEADVLYWVGCASAYEGRNQEIARSVVRLLRKAGVDVAILGNEERCTGDPARRMGDEALFQKQARRNIETLSRYRFRRIVTHCSHCYHSLRNEYPLLREKTSPPASLEAQRTAEDRREGTERESGLKRFSLPVIHHTQLLHELLQEGRLEPRAQSPEPRTITYHDSCYLGRYNGEFDAPRELLKAVPGVTLQEMPRNRENGFCCGGGGGCSWIDVPAERRVADIRLEEALTLQPNVVASACPFCLTMFEGSALKQSAGVVTKDVAELLDEAMGGAG